MYTKEQLKKQLENMGLTGDEKILIHSSMKSIGEVEGGQIQYLMHGLNISDMDFYFFQHIHGRI